MHDVLKPQQIFAGRYRIERFLAEGGMGAVFVGEHLATEQRVAVKVLWPHVLASKTSIDNFALEARIAGRVVSDHIVRVIDAGFDETTRMPYLVMELLEGRTLEAIVEGGGPLAPTLVYEYMRQVAAGLDRAHAYIDKEGVTRPIVHRDLKPANLFLTQRESGEPLVKILDFGIAKIVTEGTHVSQEVRGTPLFMAYEQASGGKITPQTDVWALGLIAFWLLSGRYYWRSAQPESSSGMTQLFGEVLTLPLEPPSDRLAELGRVAPWGPQFDTWFRRCVNRDPSARFGTAGAAADALAIALGVARRSSSGRFSALPFVGPASDARIAPSAITGGALSRTRNPPSATGSRRWRLGTSALLVAIGAGTLGFAAFRRSRFAAPHAEPSAGAEPALVTPPAAPTLPIFPASEPAAIPPVASTRPPTSADSVLLAKPPARPNPRSNTGPDVRPTQSPSREPPPAPTVAIPPARSVDPYGER